MPEQGLLLLYLSAVSIALVHALVGVDHYLPFIVLGRALRWSWKKTAAVTALCGLGHVLSSVFLGVVGIGAGVALGKLEWVESQRGEVAGWLLIGFGLAFGSYALIRRMRGKRHAHLHAHADGTVHSHEHAHAGEHLHPHLEPPRGFVTVWSLFIIFALGPCEPLIPLLMVPAVAHAWWAVATVCLLFGAVTLAVMEAVVLIGLFAPELIGRSGRAGGFFRALAPHGEVLAGLAIAVSGLVVRLLGL